MGEHTPVAPENKSPLLLLDAGARHSQVMLHMRKYRFLSMLCWQLCRPFQDGRAEEGAALAADPALSLERISEAMRGFFQALSEPNALPEFDGLQACANHICLAPWER